MPSDYVLLGHVVSICTHLAPSSIEGPHRPYFQLPVRVQTSET